MGQFKIFPSDVGFVPQSRRPVPNSSKIKEKKVSSLLNADHFIFCGCKTKLFSLTQLNFLGPVNVKMIQAPISMKIK